MLRRTGWHELENQSADCVRLVFSGGTGKSIRPLESVWSNFHLPILARARTGNRHPPLSSLVSQRVLDIGDDLLCELRIAEILQFDCDSHRTAILSFAASASLLQNARALLSPRTEGAPGPLLSVNIPLNGGPSFSHLVRPFLSAGSRDSGVENGKGCDIGYVPAICSCEGADSVDTCTVAALDAIAAFAVPNPGSSSQSQPVFSGLVALQVALMSRSLSLLRTDKFYFANPFSRRRETN